MTGRQAGKCLFTQPAIDQDRKDFLDRIDCDSFDMYNRMADLSRFAPYNLSQTSNLEKSIFDLEKQKRAEKTNTWREKGESGMFSPFIKPCLEHSFPQPAIFYKVLLQFAQLPVQQVICLVDEAEDCVGGGFRRRGFDIGLISRI